MDVEDRGHRDGRVNADRHRRAKHATYPARNGRIAFAADTGEGPQLYTVRPNR